MVFGKWKEKFGKLFSSEGKRVESFSELVSGVKEVREVSPGRSGHHGSKFEVRIEADDDFSNGEPELLEKRLEENFFDKFGKGKLEEWGNRFENLERAGANVPEFVAPDYERNSLFFKILSPEGFVDCANTNEMKDIVNEHPEVAEEMGRQMARAHKAGYSIKREEVRRKGRIQNKYTPLSPMFLVKREEEEGEGYKPFFVDVAHFDKIDDEEKRKENQVRELKQIVEAQLSPRGEMGNEAGQRFAEGYFDQAEDIGLGIDREDLEEL